MAKDFYVCYKCKKQVSNSEAVVEESAPNKDGKTTKHRFHKECHEQHQIDRIEKQKFDKVYDYVRYDILRYSEGKVSKYLINRLQALRYGEYNSRIKKNIVAYTYDQIYYTFVFCKKSILDAIRINDFNDEKHMINYIMSIVLGSINDVCNRMEKKKKSEESLVGIVIDTSNNNNQYIKKERSKVASLLKDLV